MTAEVVTDRAALQQQYVDGRSLEARAGIYAWQVPQHDLVATVLAHLPRTSAPVLDAGCGRGQYLAALAAAGHAAVGVDLSLGLATAAAGASGAGAINADATSLPVPDGSVGAALAMHMLHHLPDPRTGLRELHRVVRPGGRVLILTNGRDHLLEHREVLAASAAPGHTAVSADKHFTAEDRPLVEEVFGPVEAVELLGSITLDHVAPMVAYAASSREFYEGQVGLPWDDFICAFEANAEALLAQAGVIRIRTRSVLFVAERR